METLKVFITLLALINPFGAIPMFLSLTAGQSARERLRARPREEPGPPRLVGAGPTWFPWARPPPISRGVRT